MKGGPGRVALDTLHAAYKRITLGSLAKDYIAKIKRLVSDYGIKMKNHPHNNGDYIEQCVKMLARLIAAANKNLATTEHQVFISQTCGDIITALLDQSIETTTAHLNLHLLLLLPEEIVQDNNSIILIAINGATDERKKQIAGILNRSIANLIVTIGNHALSGADILLKIIFTLMLSSAENSDDLKKPLLDAIEYYLTIPDLYLETDYLQSILKKYLTSTEFTADERKQILGMLPTKLLISIIVIIHQDPLFSIRPAQMIIGRVDSESEQVINMCLEELLSNARPENENFFTCVNNSLDEARKIAESVNKIDSSRIQNTIETMIRHVTVCCLILVNKIDITNAHYMLLVECINELFKILQPKRLYDLLYITPYFGILLRSVITEICSKKDYTTMGFPLSPAAVSYAISNDNLYLEKQLLTKDLTQIPEYFRKTLLWHIADSPNTDQQISKILKSRSTSNTGSAGQEEIEMGEIKPSASAS